MEYKGRHRRPLGELSPLLKQHLRNMEAERRRLRDMSRDKLPS